MLVHGAVAQKSATSTVSGSIISGEMGSYATAGNVEWLDILRKKRVDHF